jgi:hypothetical protein
MGKNPPVISLFFFFSIVLQFLCSTIRGSRFGAGFCFVGARRAVPLRSRMDIGFLQKLRKYSHNDIIEIRDLLSTRRMMGK